MSKIVIFTDLHYGEDISGKNREGINTFGDTFHLLEELKADIDEINPEVIINLGDLVFGSTKERKLVGYKYLKNNFLNSVSQPVYHMLGNHEFFIANVEEIEKILGKMERITFEVGNTKHIILDIALSENKLFEVPQDTVSWLQHELVSENEVIIYCHFPITEEKENVSYVFGEDGHRAFLENSKELRDLIRGTNCKYWISGHTHFEYWTEIDGIKHITLPSFAENNNGKPNGQYAVFDTQTMSFDIKRISF